MERRIETRSFGAAPTTATDSPREFPSLHPLDVRQAFRIRPWHYWWITRSRGTTITNESGVHRNGRDSRTRYVRVCVPRARPHLLRHRPPSSHGLSDVQPSLRTNFPDRGTWSKPSHRNASPPPTYIWRGTVRLPMALGCSSIKAPRNTDPRILTIPRSSSQVVAHTVDTSGAASATS